MSDEADEMVALEQVELGNDEEGRVLVGFHNAGVVVSIAGHKTGATLSFSWNSGLLAGLEILHRASQRFRGESGADRPLPTLGIRFQSCRCGGDCGHLALVVGVGSTFDDHRDLLFRAHRDQLDRIMGELAMLMPPKGGTPS